MTYRVIGTCSICGGDVQVFSGAWGGINPPTPSCVSCHATPRNVGPVIQMEGGRGKRQDWEQDGKTLPLKDLAPNR